jgi:hypothetical protein
MHFWKLQGYIKIFLSKKIKPTLSIMPLRTITYSTHSPQKAVEKADKFFFRKRQGVEHLQALFQQGL